MIFPRTLILWDVTIPNYREWLETLVYYYYLESLKVHHRMDVKVATYLLFNYF